jgi:FHA domain-containing protein
MALCPSGHESETSDYCDTCGALMGGSPITPSTPAATGAGVGTAAGVAAAELGATLPASAGRPGEVCPTCGTARSGRFCEEDGYDFELAALVPPGEAPAPPVFELKPEPETPSPNPVPDPAAPLVPPPVGTDPLAATAVLGPDFDLEAELEAAERAAKQPEATATSAESTAPPAPAPAPVAAPAGLAAVAHADQEYYDAQVQRGDIVETEFPFPKYSSERRFALEGDRVRIGRASASRGIVVEIDLTGPPLDPAVSHLHAQLLRTADGSWAIVDLNSANGTRLNGAEDPIAAETEIPVKAGDRIHLGVWTTLTLEDS